MDALHNPKPIKRENIFEQIPARLPEELIQEIATCGRVRIERILSRGHCSADGFWYDQNWDEWVLLIQGGAGLDVAGRPTTIELMPGDHVLIPAGVKHRVAWTAAEETTIWLAIHIDGPDEAA
jgi:cupin 2 domain-containing protein